MMESNPGAYNHLANEKSDYLQLHAQDPILWYPWTEQAFELAREEDKPIFLSIGYFACHWCRQMQKEVFSSQELAALLNQYCICIKVDKEELGEVFNLYARFTQALIGEFATFPLNLFLTPEGEPFLAKSYLPLKSQFGSMGMFDYVEEMKQAWYSEEKEETEKQAERVVELFSEDEQVPEARGLLSFDDLESNTLTLFQLADPLYGGMSGLPKTYNTCHLFFLFHLVRIKNSARSLFYLKTTLDHMARGGVYDILGGGFCAYGIERKWCVPHFEKLLGDNAFLVELYLWAYCFTSENNYKEVGFQTLHFLLQHFKAQEGAYVSAICADKDHTEGLYDTWSQKEIEDCIGDDGFAQLFLSFYDVSEGGNFEGRNLLHQSESIDEFATKYNKNPEELCVRFKRMQQMLSVEKQKRSLPEKDKKILCSANALLASSLCLAYQLTASETYLKEAKSILTFIEKHLFIKGDLYRRWIDKEAKYEATLDDYSTLVRAYLAVFEVSGDWAYLEKAKKISHDLEDKFLSEELIYYYSNTKDLPLDVFEFQDRSLPSGNAMQTENLFKLYRYTGEFSYLEKAKHIIKRVSGHLLYHPLNTYYHLKNVIIYQELKQDLLPVFILGQEPQCESTKKMKQAFYFNQKPQAMAIWLTHETFQEAKKPPFMHVSTKFDPKQSYLLLFQANKNMQQIEGQEAICEYLESEPCLI